MSKSSGENYFMSWEELQYEEQLLQCARNQDRKSNLEFFKLLLQGESLPPKTNDFLKLYTKYNDINRAVYSSSETVLLHLIKISTGGTKSDEKKINDLCKILVNKHEASLHHADYLGQNSLIYAYNAKNLEMINFALQHVIPSNMLAYQHPLKIETLLSSALRNNNTDKQLKLEIQKSLDILSGKNKNHFLELSSRDNYKGFWHDLFSSKIIDPTIIISEIDLSTTPNFDSLASIAVRDDNTEALITIAQKLPTGLNQLLHHVCSTKVLQFFIEQNVDINAKNENGETLLHISCKIGRADIIELLMKNGAIISTDNNGNTPIHMLAALNIEKGIVDIMEKLLTSNNAHDAIHQKNTKGLNVLDIANQRDNPRLFNMLLNNLSSKDLDIADEKGNTEAHRAVIKNDLELFKMLHQKGANINAQNKAGETPLHIACTASNEGLVKYIMSTADVNPNIIGGSAIRSTPLMTVVLAHNNKLLKYMLEKSDPNLDGVVHRACKGGAKYLDTTKLLLSTNKVDLEAKDRRGLTVFDIAKKQKDGEVTKLLTAYKFGNIDNYQMGNAIDNNNLSEKKAELVAEKQENIFELNNKFKNIKLAENGSNKASFTDYSDPKELSPKEIMGYHTDYSEFEQH